MAFAINRLNKNLYLQGAQSFNQYNINRHLITIIGEIHLSAYIDCKYKPNKTVSDFMIERVKNPDTKLLLEIYPEFKDYGIIIGSKNIMDTCKKAEEQKIDISKIIGFDLRRNILSNTNQDVLYHHPEQLLQLSSEAINDIYVRPLSNGIGIIDMMHPDKSKFFDGKRWIIDQSKYEYLELGFLGDIIAHCRSILSELQKWNSLNMEKKEDVVARSNIIYFIQTLWMKVADYLIVKEIFTLSRRDNLVVLCGENHANNIEKIFKEYLIFEKTGSNGDCINLNGCYTSLD